MITWRRFSIRIYIKSRRTITRNRDHKPQSLRRQPEHRRFGDIQHFLAGANRALAAEGDLADALLADAQEVADLTQAVRAVACQTETQVQDLLLPRPQVLHEEADGLEPQGLGDLDVLLGDVGLRAVRGDTGDLDAHLVDLAQVVGEADAGQQQARDLGVLRHLAGLRDELLLRDGGEAVVERRAADAVTVGDLDHGDACAVETLDESRLPAGDVTVAVEYSTLNYKDGLVLTSGGGLVKTEARTA